MERLESSEIPYLVNIKEEINRLNITSEYKTALIKCVEKLFNPDQLLKDIYIDEFDRKVIFAERDLVLTRLSATKGDLLGVDPYIRENNILRLYRAYISKKLK